MFLGIAEDIVGAVKYAKKFIEIPEEFDAVISILTLHHCIDIEIVYKNIRKILSEKGKAVIVDLCEHSFEEFREEMGDIHLGFKPEFIRKIAERFFPKTSIRKILGICYKCSSRSAELSVAYLTML